MPDKCFHCNGYYGPSYGQPLCSTCHMFLYDPPNHSTTIQGPEKVDECDSGNEEPREPSECQIDSTSLRRRESSALSGSSEGSTDEEDNNSNGANMDRPAVSPNASGALSNALYSATQQNAFSCAPGHHPPQLEFGNIASRTNEPSLACREKEETACASCSTCDSNEGFPEKDKERPSLRDEKEREEYKMTSSFHDMTLDWTGASETEDDSNTALQDVDRLSQQGGSYMSRMPPEVLLLVFGLLDDFSLWSVGQVCRQWYELVSSCRLNNHWKELTKRRFPLFSPLYKVINWHKVFTFLVESAPCQMCLLRMPNTPVGPNHEENSWRRTRLSNELRTLKTDPPEGISASPLDDLSLHWQACIRGPLDSPYAGGTFLLYIEIPQTYPLKPPVVRFITKIFHPNVSRHGDIGIDSIQHNWSLALTISKVLISIQSLLTDPYTEVCMEPRIGEMYDQNRSQFELIAQAWTWRYAMVDTLTPENLTAGFLQEIIMRRTVDKEQVEGKSK